MIPNDEISKNFSHHEIDKLLLKTLIWCCERILNGPSSSVSPNESEILPIPERGSSVPDSGEALQTEGATDTTLHRDESLNPPSDRLPPPSEDGRTRAAREYKEREKRSLLAE